jgi:hypothetical protein
MDRKFDMLQEAESRLEMARSRWEHYFKQVQHLSYNMASAFESKYPELDWETARDDEYPKVQRWNFPTEDNPVWSDWVWPEWEHIDELRDAYKRLYATRKTYDKALAQVYDDAKDLYKDNNDNTN